jgi:hypothetical protein
MSDAPAERAPANPSRRRLLKIGIAGAVVLAAVPLFVRDEKTLAKGFQQLRDADVDLWRALIPAMLGGVLPADAAAREPLVAEILYRIDGAIALLRPALRKATFDMLDFVETKAPRVLSGGYWGAWHGASVEDAAGVLESWSTSKFDLLRVCYRSLHDLVMGSWYAMPQSWAAVGYPGPPQIGAAAPLTAPVGVPS